MLLPWEELVYFVLLTGELLLPKLSLSWLGQSIPEIQT
jgi:hypothetical protein